MKFSYEILPRPAQHGVDPITPDERLRREEAERFARASVGLEGFTPTKTAEALSLRYIAGEITIDQAIEQLIQHYKATA